MDGLLESLLSTFYRDSIAYEPVCDGGANCNVDMKAYKSLNLRWIASTVQLCPWTQQRILPVLRASAKAAVAQCTGGANGRMCGIGWWSQDTPLHTTDFDGNTGLGQEMAALSALMAVLLVEERKVVVETSTLVGSRPEKGSDSPSPSSAGTTSPPESESQSEGFTMVTLPKPATHDTGGTSVGDGRAGKRPGRKLGVFEPPTQAGVLGASIATALLIVGLFCVFIWMCTDSLESTSPCKLPDEERPDACCSLVPDTEEEKVRVPPSREPLQHPRVHALLKKGKQKAKIAGGSNAKRYKVRANTEAARQVESQRVTIRRSRPTWISTGAAARLEARCRAMKPSPLANTWNQGGLEQLG